MRIQNPKMHNTIFIYLLIYLFIYLFIYLLRNFSRTYMSHCQNSSKFLSFAYFMKTADVIMFFFFHMIGLIILVNGN